MSDLAIKLARYMEALTPTGLTKNAYLGEFAFDVETTQEDDEDGVYQKVYVPWKTIKEIMTAIQNRAEMFEGTLCGPAQDH